MSDNLKPPSDAELGRMTTDELARLGGKIDGVDTVLKDPRWPVEGTRAEKRSERLVAFWMMLGGVMGLLLLVVFLFWPWEYKPYGVKGNFLYSWATPMYGVTFGLSILAIGIGAVLYQKRFIPAMTAHPRRSIARPPRPLSPMPSRDRHWGAAS